MRGGAQRRNGGENQGVRRQAQVEVEAGMDDEGAGSRGRSEREAVSNRVTPQLQTLAEPSAQGDGEHAHEPEPREACFGGELEDVALRVSRTDVAMAPLEGWNSV